MQIQCKSCRVEAPMQAPAKKLQHSSPPPPAKQASSCRGTTETAPVTGDDDGSKRPPEDLSNVGLVVWQSAFMLAEFLLRAPPFGQWHDVRAVDLGSGTGVLLV